MKNRGLILSLCVLLICVSCNGAEDTMFLKQDVTSVVGEAEVESRSTISLRHSGDKVFEFIQVEEIIFHTSDDLLKYKSDYQRLAEMSWEKMDEMDGIEVEIYFENKSAFTSIRITFDDVNESDFKSLGLQDMMADELYISFKEYTLKLEDIGFTIYTD